MISTQRPYSRPFQIGACPIRYSDTKHAEVAKRTFRLGNNALFSGSLYVAKRRKDCPVEGLRARNELELIVRALPGMNQVSILNSNK